jgi:hypothetical protein
MVLLPATQQLRLQLQAKLTVLRPNKPKNKIHPMLQIPEMLLVMHTFLTFLQKVRNSHVEMSLWKNNKY